MDSWIVLSSISPSVWDIMAAAAPEDWGQEWLGDVRELSRAWLVNQLARIVASPATEFRAQARPSFEAWSQVHDGILVGDDGSGSSPQWPSWPRTWQISRSEPASAS